MCITARCATMLALIVGFVASVCAPSATFATLPSNEQWREHLLNHVVGFGENTTGGAGGTLCTVTTLSDSGAGSLRDCATTSGAQWIVFDLSGTIALSTPINVGSNKTIDGREKTIVITSADYGLILDAVSNVIIEDVTIVNTGNDAVNIRNGTTNVWVDHVTFGDSGDESLYMGSFSTTNPPVGITISWCHFPPVPSGTGAILVTDDAATWDAAMTITLHHNHYDGAYIRHPLAMWATIHALNNYYHDNEVGAQIRVHGKFYSENEILEAPFPGGYAMISAQLDNCPLLDCATVLPDNVKVLNPWLIGGATYEELNASTIFSPASYYTYTADTANEALQTAILDATTGAGAVPRPYNYVITSGNPTNLEITANAVVPFSGESTSVSITAAPVVPTLNNPTIITMGADSTPSFPGESTSSEITAAAIPTFPGEPTGASVE